MTRRQFLKGAAIVTAGSVASGGAVAFFNEANHLRVERSTLLLPRWTADGFRLALLADLHANSRPEAERARRAIQLAAAERPDAIALAGDFLNYSVPEVFEHVRHALDALPRDIPVLAVPGNHDYPEGGLGTWAALEVLRASPMTFLENRLVDVQGVTFWGMEDGLRGQDRHDLLPLGKDANTVVLFHEPDLVDRCDPRVSLMLAGHSHGGQVRFGSGRPWILPGGAIRYFDGFYPHAHVPLFVTRGVGTNRRIRVRLQCPPQVAILTLNRA